MFQNLKSRLPNGILLNQLMYSIKLKWKYPNSFIAKEVFSKLIKKYFLGKSGSSYNDLQLTLWKKLLGNQYDDEIIHVGNLKFHNEHSLISEISEIFFADLYYIPQFNDIETYICSLLLPIFSKDGPYQYKNIRINEGDIIIDAGANIGVFSLFASLTHNTKTYAFEPQKLARNILMSNIELNNKKNIEVLPLGLYSNNTQTDLIFNPEFGHVAASINGEITHDSILENINCVKLDDWVKENKIKRIDFIKADIEGAEREMLIGAVEVLKEFKPKLSICTYHLPDDREVLTNIILDANPEYKIYYFKNKLFAMIE